MNPELSTLLHRYPSLKCCETDIYRAFGIISDTYKRKGKLLICGNGGSCADAEHIVGELMKGFRKKRKMPNELAEQLRAQAEAHADFIVNSLECGLPAIALSAHSALNTAFANDKNPDLIYAQQVMGYGEQGDAFLGISTSGNAKNVVYAMEVAKAKELYTVALTGRDGGSLAKMADASIIVPATETYQIQELHLPIYHTICLMLENEFFEE
ncbi:SIS domain-containing protein [Lachnospiraceae bacterium 47-T17]